MASKARESSPISSRESVATRCSHSPAPIRSVPWRSRSTGREMPRAVSQVASITSSVANAAAASERRTSRVAGASARSRSSATTICHPACAQRSPEIPLRAPGVLTRARTGVVIGASAVILSRCPSDSPARAISLPSPRRSSSVAPRSFSPSVTTSTISWER